MSSNSEKVARYLEVTQKLVTACESAWDPELNMLMIDVATNMDRDQRGRE